MEYRTSLTIQAAFVQSQTGKRPTIEPQKVNPKFFDFVFESCPEVEKAFMQWGLAKDYQDFFAAFRELSQRIDVKKSLRGRPYK